MAAECDTCTYFVWDEDYDEYVCDVDMDEDDYYNMMSGSSKRGCPYYRSDDEYAVVKHQM